MQNFYPIRDLKNHGYKKGDVLVVFGEVFSRGYVNGLIESAEALGMKIYTGTVGRRNPDNSLRPLNSEELAKKTYPIINTPLEAGFDLETLTDGNNLCEKLQGFKLSQWQDISITTENIQEAKAKGTKSFRNRVKIFLKTLTQEIPKDANVLFAHTMAGGFPRARIVMPSANRVFKGSGDRFQASETFWASDIGKLCSHSFEAVTAETYDHLIDLSTEFRQQREAKGLRTSYVAYGYHGTEILVNGQCHWQSYAPYLQGWAKLRLEAISEQHFIQGVSTCVFNAPEILTNSSSVFLGVEIPLYTLITAFSKEAPDHPTTQNLMASCQKLMKSDDLGFLWTLLKNYFTSDTIMAWTKFAQWPQHNGPEQMQLMRETSQKILDAHKDPQHLMTAQLSEIVFKGCGHIMLHESWGPRHAYQWVGHDIIAKSTLHHQHS